MERQCQAELDALMQQPEYTKHGQWYESLDVVANVKLANMLHSKRVAREVLVFILMLSSVVTCPSMTSLFCELLSCQLLSLMSLIHQNADPCDVALDIMAQFHERGLPAIAKPEIEAFTVNSWRDIPSARHIDRVVSGFRSNRARIVNFCPKLATATTDRSLFHERAVFDDLHTTLSKCGGGYGDYQAGRFLRLWFHVKGKDEPPGHTTPTIMADGLYNALPPHLRNGTPTGMSPFQFAFQLCMVRKPVRHVDRKMYILLLGAYWKPDSQSDAAARTDDTATRAGQVSFPREYDPSTRSIEVRPPVGRLPPVPVRRGADDATVARNGEGYQLFNLNVSDCTANSRVR